MQREILKAVNITTVTVDIVIIALAALSSSESGGRDGKVKSIVLVLIFFKFTLYYPGVLVQYATAEWLVRNFDI